MFDTPPQQEYAALNITFSFDSVMMSASKRFQNTNRHNQKCIHKMPEESVFVFLAVFNIMLSVFKKILV